MINIDQSLSLCNEIRLVIIEMGTLVSKVEVTWGSNVGDIICIPCKYAFNPVKFMLAFQISMTNIWSGTTTRAS